MEEPKRPTIPKPVRGGKFFSRFKGIIRLPLRKASSNAPNATQKPALRETRGRANLQTLNHPYSRASIAMKPYMSQPMLSLQRTSMDSDTDQHPQPSYPDSDLSSASANTSPCRLNSDFPLPTAGRPPYIDSRRHSRTLSMHSLSYPPLEEFGAPRTVSNTKTIDGTPVKQELPRSNQLQVLQPSKNAFQASSPPPPPPKPEGLQTNNAKGHKPHEPIMPPTPPSKQNSYDLPAVTSGFKSFGKLLIARPLPPVPPPSTSHSVLSSVVLQTPPSNNLPNENANTDDARSKRPFVITHGSSPTVPTRSTLSLHRPSTSGHEPSAQFGASAALVPPAPMMRSLSEAGGEALQSIANQTSTSAQETSEKEPPKLTMPTSLNRRISLIVAAGGSARLSPSIMHRPPPLPILNLPKLPPIASSSGGDGSAEGASISRRRSERAGLGSMPALPIQGTNRDVGGQEEVDDTEDDEEDTEDSDEEGTDDDEHGDEYDDPARTSTSTVSGTGFSEGSLTGRGSYELPSFEPMVGQKNFRPELPPLSISSPLDIRFHGPSSSSSSTSGMMGLGITSDKKGKNKQVSMPFGIVPTMEGYDATFHSGQHTYVAPPNPSSRPSWRAASSSTGGPDYFTNRLEIPEPMSFSHSQSSENSDRTPLAQRSDPFAGSSSSPSATPRALSNYEVPSAELKTRIRNAANGGGHANNNRNSFVFGANNAGHLLVQRPSMYKRASRSLIDIHEIAKKEEVEKMVREEEEEQERERRRRSIRRNRNTVIIGAKGGLMNRSTLVQPDALGTMEEETLLKQEGEDASASATTRPTSATNLVLAGGPSGNKFFVEGSRLENDIVLPVGTVMVGGSRTSRILQTSPGGGETTKRLSKVPAFKASNPLPLRKRRSMPTFNETTAPPPYPSFAPHPYGLPASIQILPREDEGREALPPYSNHISLRAIMPRKMEFSGPGVQAKDRKWKRVLCVLEGTMLKIYRCPVGTGGVSAIEQWWESKVGAGDVALYMTTSGPASQGNKTNGAAAIGGDEEKVNQQYLRSTMSNEPRLDSGSQSVEQPAPSIAQPSGSVYGAEIYPKGQQKPVAITKSAMNMAVQFLKPGSRHMRSNSDSGPPSPTTVRNQIDSRPSLNLPTSGNSTPTGSRSQSPMPSSSRSHSPMPSQSSSRLTIPSTASSLSTRPPTPNTAGSGISSRLRNSAPKSARSDTSKRTNCEELKSCELNPHDLIRCYTMQHAESGLGNDYVKRKNVIRVRLDGEQFLLQAKDVAEVVQWIEALQAATNIALDLDDRPMPRGPIFPRRRRRRRPNVPPITTSGAQIRTSLLMESYTPTSATAGQPALRRTT